MLGWKAATIIHLICLRVEVSGPTWLENSAPISKFHNFLADEPITQKSSLSHQIIDKNVNLAFYGYIV